MSLIGLLIAIMMLLSGNGVMEGIGNTKPPHESAVEETGTIPGDQDTGKSKEEEEEFDSFDLPVILIYDADAEENTAAETDSSGAGSSGTGEGQNPQAQNPQEENTETPEIQNGEEDTAAQVMEGIGKFDLPEIFD